MENLEQKFISEKQEISKQEAKSDAAQLVHAAIDVLEGTSWKTRQDQRAANKVYTYLLAAEKALGVAQLPKGKNNERKTENIHSQD